MSIVIATSNGARFLRPCLGALRRTEIPTGHEMEVIVVDNGSSDDTPTVLREHREVRALTFPRRLGFARANNAARSVATGDAVYFLNNDTVVEPEWLRRPIELFESDPRIAAIGSKLLFLHEFVQVRFSLPPGVTALVSGRYFGTALDSKVRFSADVGLELDHLGERVRRVSNASSVFLPVPIRGIDPDLPRPPAVRVVSLEGGLGAVELAIAARRTASLRRLPGLVVLEDLGDLPTVRLVQNAGTFLNELGEGGDVGSGEMHSPSRYASEEVVPALCGAALFVRRSVLDAVGWFPEYYNVYYEDVDLCLRLRARGGLLVFCPSSIVNHYHTGTNREWSPTFVENVARSSLLFISRYGRPRLIARTLARRARDVGAEVRRAGLPRVIGLWWTGHSTRGLLKALPALPRILRERAVDEARHRLPGDLLSFQRAPYVDSQ